MSSCPSFALTPLIETVPTAATPAGFVPAMAWLLAQCCSLTYSQWDSGLNVPLNLSTLQLTSGGSGNLTLTNIQPFQVSESNGPAAATGDVGAFSTEAAGFGVVISQNAGTVVPNTPAEFVVIALRGTQSWDEWFDDARAIPAYFGKTAGSIHAGFYSYYVVGTDGVPVKSGVDPIDPTPANRAPGSIAAQVAAYVSGLTSPLPIFVTGHSLGGAIASLCALDIAMNFSAHASAVSMYNFASPRVAVGAIATIGTFPIDIGSAQAFLQLYQGKVPQSFRIVHECDIVPILPMTTMTFGSLVVEAAHVTDAWSYGGSNGSLAQNVLNFCAQTGDVACNHSCLSVYLPYVTSLV